MHASGEGRLAAIVVRASGLHRLEWHARYGKRVRVIDVPPPTPRSPYQENVSLPSYIPHALFAPIERVCSGILLLPRSHQRGQAPA